MFAPFPNRELPPLLPNQSFAQASLDRLQGPGYDSLLSNRIMTPRDLNERNPRYQTRNSVQEASSPTSARDSFAITSTDPSRDHEESSPNEFVPTRKRIVSQSDRGTWDLNKILSPLPTSDTTYPSPDHLSQVCLCQPDPKVPRPRNAFILFRQHRQAEVVAKNPGLANPEISKLIGEEWRNLLPEVRDRWKGLAEEEKIRHQREHPDYRYQPRRSTRGNINGPSTGSSSGSAESPRCPKCGGKSMGSSNIMGPHSSTPSTPMTPRTGIALQTPFSMNSSGVRMLSQMGSPPRNSVRFGREGAAPQTPRSSQRHPYSDDEPMSPETKRRKFGNGQYIPVGVHNRQTPHVSNFSRRESLPRPDFMPKTHFAMQAPPRPHQSSYTSQHPPPNYPLTLPPLKTGSESEATTQAKSVEAMVMSIPVLNKIKVLAKISSPLRKPGPASPAFATRGAIIAVDGPDQEAVTTVIQYLSDFLSRDNEFTVKIWDNSNIPALPNPEDMTFASYLQLITHQHTISQEMIRHITTIPSSTSTTTRQSQSHSPPISPRTPAPASTHQRELRARTKAQSTTITTSEDDQQRQQQQPSKTQQASSSTTTSSSQPPIPLALIPSYQLSLTDLYASGIPITDSFAPIDHWQWLANVWRGTVGADVTIAVKSDNENAKRRTSSGGGGGVEVLVGGVNDAGPRRRSASASASAQEPETSPHSKMATVPTTTTTTATASQPSALLLHGLESTSGPSSSSVSVSGSAMKVLVENRLADARALILRGLGERELRRVGFEVGEWVRGLSVEFGGGASGVEGVRDQGRRDSVVGVGVESVNERVVRENAVARRGSLSLGEGGQGQGQGQGGGGGGRREGREGRRGSYEREREKERERDGRYVGVGNELELVGKMGVAVGH